MIDNIYHNIKNVYKYKKHLKTNAKTGCTYIIEQVLGRVENPQMMI